MRFRKSITICKGVRVNFSKSGPSLTVGGRGASINVGKKGAFLNTSIPGTGLYDRIQIAGSSSNGGNKSRRKSSSSVASSNHPLPPKSISIEYLDDGNVIIRDENKNRITDTYILKKIKQTEQYKQEIQRLSKERLDNSEFQIQEFVGIYHKSCHVYTIADYQNEIIYLQNLKYERNDFDEKDPDENIIIQELQKQAEQEISTWKFWRKKDLINDYVNEHLKDAVTESWTRWERKKKIIFSVFLDWDFLSQAI